MSAKSVHNIRFYNVEPQAIHCLAYESVSKKLALSRSDGSIEVWDLSHALHIERSLPARAKVSVEALTWCGQRLFSGSFQGLVTEYDLLNLTVKCEVPVTAGACWCVASNRSRTRLAAGTEDGCINIFNVKDDELLFEKILNRQEGRILCISWDASGDLIITGSIDAIRVWNVGTGHAVHRMDMGRQEAKRETIVWCLAVTSDLTIISGDSRGRISFWDGNVGTQLESFRSHNADILCLCLAADENSVYCAGVDPVIMCFTKVSLRGGSGRSKWVRSVQRRIHDHDVRALALAEDKLLSAGVDGYLAISKYPPKVLVKYPPILQAPCVVLCPRARYVMLRHAAHLEVWKLGSSSPVEDGSGVQEGLLPLIEDPVRLLTFKSHGGEAIVCADMSSNGQWLAYSTVDSLSFFRFRTGRKLSLHKTPLSFDMSPAHRIKFTPDSCRAVVATSTGDIVVIQLGGEELVLDNLSHARDNKLLRDAVHLLTVSQDGQYVVAADHQGHIVVWTLTDLKHYCSLPRYKCAPTALAVHPSTNTVVCVYSDHKVVEYSLRHRRYTRFSQGLEKRHPVQWLSRGFAVVNITFDLKNEDIILLQDDNAICVINKNKELPEVEAKIPRIGSPQSDSLEGSQSHPGTAVPQHAFHVIKKYKHLVHLECLSADELVAVEVNPLKLAENLPPPLKQKRFGGM